MGHVRVLGWVWVRVWVRVRVGVRVRAKVKVRARVRLGLGLEVALREGDAQCQGYVALRVFVTVVCVTFRLTINVRNVLELDLGGVMVWGKVRVSFRARVRVG